MKALLLKPLDNLTVGKIYTELYYDDDCCRMGCNESDITTSCSSLDEFFSYWFAFQSVPEQIKQQLETAIVDTYFNGVIAGPNRKYVKAVVGVLEGEQ